MAEDVFSKKIDTLLKKKLSALEKSDNEFLKGWDAIEKTIFDRVRNHVSKMNQSDGALEFDQNNVVMVNELNKIIRDALKAGGYDRKVAEYLRDFDTIKEVNKQINGDVNGLTEKEMDKLLNPVQKQMVDQTVDGLLGSGIDAGFTTPMKNGIMRNIVSGSTITDMTAWLEQYIVTNDKRLGTLKRYSTQISRDALNQYDGQINSRIASEFGLDAGRYVGSLIDDSRPQCVRWVGKEILLFDELESEINWAFNNGTGMIPGTNQSNFATYRGGYNCRHSFIPFKMTKSQRAEYENR